MSGLLIRLAVLIAIFASVFLFSQLAIGYFVNRGSERNAVNRRLTMLRSGLGREAVNVTLLKNAPPVLGPNAGPLQKFYVRLVRMVMMAGVRFSTRQLLTGTGIGFCVVTGTILLLAATAHFRLTLGVVQLVAVLSAAIAVGLPILVISRLAQRRYKRMEEQFPIALDIFTRSLRAGHPIASAIFLITEEMGDPIGSEFGIVSDEVTYGANLVDALVAMAERWNLEDMRMFVVSVSVQNETGGNLAEILENLSSVIRARASMYMKVRALSSEGRMSAWMLTALPVLTLVSMVLVAPGFYLGVAQDPIFFVGFGSLITLYIIGVVIIRMIVDLKV